MARILLVVVLLAGAAAAGAALFVHGSEAAAKPPARPALPATPAAGPPALPEAVTTIQRTFVSTAGNDANPCTPTQPCRSFAVAIANTTAGGEVVAVDSGGYGPFTVDKAITIAGAPGAHVAISVFSGTGITVNAAGTDRVVLRNLYLSGLGGQEGIVFQGSTGGSLHVESVVAAGFSQRGLFAGPLGGTSLIVRDSVFRHNDTGVLVIGELGESQVEIADSRADRNNFGFLLSTGAVGSIVRSAATGNLNDGFDFEHGAKFAVSDSLADGNGAGVVVLDDGTQATLSAVTLSNNFLQGLWVEDGTPVARIGGSTVTGNGTGLLRTAGTLETFGDNLVRGNTTDTTGTITTVGKT